MSNVPATIDANAFQQRVKAHVVGTFGSLIPDDQMDAMIAASVKEFFDAPKEVFVVEKEFLKPGKTANDWDAKYKRNVLQTPISPFKQLVWNEISVLVKERLGAYMSDSNKTNPITLFLDELFKIPSFENHQVLTTQEMMLAMAGQMMYQYMNQHGLSVKNEISAVFLRANMPELASKVWQS